MWSQGMNDEMSRPMNDLDTIFFAVDRSDNDVTTSAFAPMVNTIENILIVEHDADCADALESLLTDLPGIARVKTAGTASAAFELLDDGSYDVVGFGAGADTIPTTPDVIFIGAHQPDTFTSSQELMNTVASLRERVPHASIVLLCVYPNQYRDALGEMVDGCIRKDTSARELRDLIDELREDRSNTR